MGKRSVGIRMMCCANGATETTYTASSAGTYKAEVTGSCTRTDEVVLSSSNSLEVTASNEGIFCVGGSPSEVTISVSGGEGVYNYAMMLKRMVYHLKRVRNSLSMN